MPDLLSQFIRNSPVIAFVKDLEGRYRHVSNAWLEAFHTTEDAIIGKSDHELFPPAQAAGLTRQLLLFSRKEVLSRRMPVDLHDVLGDALTILQRTLGRRITMVVERRAAHSRMLADSAQLSTAIINLAINARDAMLGRRHAHVSHAGRGARAHSAVGGRHRHRHES